MKAVFKVKKRLLTPEKKLSNTKFLFLKSGTRQVKIQYDDIIYLESDDNYLKFVLKDEKHLCRMNISEMEERLPSSKFLRIHKSYMINLDPLKTIENHRLFVGDIWLPVGRKYKNAVLVYLNEYLR